MDENEETLAFIDEDEKVMTLDRDAEYLVLSMYTEDIEGNIIGSYMTFRPSLVQKIELVRYLNESIKRNLEKLCNQ